jgi:hypothetical protein
MSHKLNAVKGTVSQDFRPSVFFHKTIPPGSLIHGLKPFWILLRIRWDIIDFRTQKSCTACIVHAVSVTLHAFLKIRISSRIRIYIRKGFSPRRMFWWKQPKISWHCPFTVKQLHVCYFGHLYFHLTICYCGKYWMDLAVFKGIGSWDFIFFMILSYCLDVKGMSRLTFFLF